MLQPLGNERQRDQVLGDGAIRLSRPEIVFFLILCETGNPAAGLQECDGFHLILAGHPEQQLAVIAGGVEPATYDFQPRHLREVSHQSVGLSGLVDDVDGSVHHSVCRKSLLLIIGIC